MELREIPGVGKSLCRDLVDLGYRAVEDLQGENPEDMYRSLFGKLLKLNDDVEVFPGHDYGVMPHSKIGFERKTNYTLEDRSSEEFVKFMEVT